MPLVEPPLCHVQSRPRGLDCGALCTDLAVAPHWRQRLRERRPIAVELGLRCAQIGALLIDELHGGGTGLQQHFVAGEVGSELVMRRLIGGEIGLRQPDFRGLARGLQIGELLLGLVELMRRLIARRKVRGGVLIEQRRLRGDLVAARDVNGREQPLLGRSDLHEIRVGIALPGNWRRDARAEPPPAGISRSAKGEHEHEKEPSVQQA